MKEIAQNVESDAEAAATAPGSEQTNISKAQHSKVGIFSTMFFQPHFFRSCKEWEEVSYV